MIQVINTPYNLNWARPETAYSRTNAWNEVEEYGSNIPKVESHAQDEPTLMERAAGTRFSFSSTHSPPCGNRLR